MKKFIQAVALLLISVCLFTACNTNNLEANTENTYAPDSGGTYDFCPIHDINFHSISTDWMNYVGGQEVFEKWIEEKLTVKKKPYYSDLPCGGIGITDLIEDFNISKETFYKIDRPPLSQETIDFFAERGEKMTDEIYYNRYSYTDEQIEAFYSNDSVKIASAICGDLAFVDQKTGKLYSIYWLANHTPQEYIDANLSMEQVEALIKKVYSEESRSLGGLAKQAEKKFKTALSLIKSKPLTE